MATAWRNLYVLLMAAWFGIMGYYTGILTPTLTRAFPAEFGRIVAALFPGYFRLGEVLALAATLAALLELRSRRTGATPPPPSRGGTGPRERPSGGRAASGPAAGPEAAEAPDPGAPAAPIRPRLSVTGRRLALAVAALVLVTVNRELVLPAAHAARGTDAFGALHGLSMGINLLTGLLALAGVASGLWAPAAPAGPDAPAAADGGRPRQTGRP